MRFDYIKYNETTAALQQAFKEKFVDLESSIEALKPGRAKALCLTALEEAYMWVGKALRDQQIETSGPAHEEAQRGES